jgi:hypothetical protein
MEKQIWPCADCTYYIFDTLDYIITRPTIRFISKKGINLWQARETPITILRIIAAFSGYQSLPKVAQRKVFPGLLVACFEIYVQANVIQ